MKFLGYVIFKEWVVVDPTKINAIMQWERPKTVTEVKSFFGLAGYYRRFIKEFSQLVIPLTRLTRKNHPFEWNSDYEASFQELKVR